MRMCAHVHQGQGWDAKGSRAAKDSRHGLVDGFHPIAHGKLIHDLLCRLIKVNLPGVVPFGVGDLHHAVVL